MAKDEVKETGAESATVPAVDVSDIDERVAGFNEYLKAGLAKYELALMAEARIFEGKIVADPKVIDARGKVKPEEKV